MPRPDALERRRRDREAAEEAARERAEEEVFEAEVLADGLPAIDNVIVSRPAKVVRQYVRAVLIEPALKRLYAIGMGIERFDVPTMAGNVVRVPAPAAVQRLALADLVKIGLPAAHALVDEGDDRGEGVIALGPLGLAIARQQAEADRFGGPQETGPPELAAGKVADGSAGRQPYQRRPDLEYVEIVEDHSGAPPPAADPDAPPAPPPQSEAQRLAAALLAKRRRST